MRFTWGILAVVSYLPIAPLLRWYHRHALVKFPDAGTVSFSVLSAYSAGIEPTDYPKREMRGKIQEQEFIDNAQIDIIENA